MGSLKHIGWRNLSSDYIVPIEIKTVDLIHGARAGTKLGAGAHPELA